MNKYKRKQSAFKPQEWQEWEKVMASYGVSNWAEMLRILRRKEVKKLSTGKSKKVA